MNKYTIKGLIGEGSFSKVYKGVNNKTGELVAIKKLNKKYDSINEYSNESEAKFLLSLEHKNIINLKEIIHDKKNKEVSLILEYCHCNLFEFIKYHLDDNKLINPKVIKSIIYQILKGLYYLHRQNILHRDLKPENIFLQKNEESKSKFIAKIGDFGTAIKLSQNNRTNLKEYVCTRWYRAPECVLGTKQYDQKSDIWAIGCIMAEMYLLKPLFPGTNYENQLDVICEKLGTPETTEWPEGYKLIKRFKREMPIFPKQDLKNFIPSLDINALNFLRSIFIFDQEKRTNCYSLLKSSFFKLKSKIKIKISDSNNNQNNKNETKTIGNIPKSPLKNKSTQLNNLNKQIAKSYIKINLKKSFTNEKSVEINCNVDSPKNVQNFFINPKSVKIIKRKNNFVNRKEISEVKIYKQRIIRNKISNNKNCIINNNPLSNTKKILSLKLNERMSNLYNKNTVLFSPFNEFNSNYNTIKSNTISLESRQLALNIFARENKLNQNRNISYSFK